MPRNRMISPEFWSDEEIGLWSHSARLFYIGLWNFADDEGRFKAHNQLLKSQIFPYDANIDIEALKRELNHKIQWYEQNGSQYGFINNFLKHQRIDKPYPSKLPPPPPFDERSPNIPRTVPPKIKENKIKEVKNQPYWAAFKETTQGQMKAVYKNFNIYQFLTKLKKNRKVELPEGVIERICASYLKNKPIKTDWGWFIVVAKKEWEAWNAEEQIRQGKEWKVMPVSPVIAQILKGIGKQPFT